MNNTGDAKKIIQAYEEKAQKILQEMYTILVRAQRKIDDEKYRELLEKLEGGK